MDSLGVYIAVPFCRAKCTYCNFASSVSSAGIHERYVARVCDDIRKVRQRLESASLPGCVDTVYLGGGTPSLLSPGLVSEVGHTLRQQFRVSPSAEITLECAPGQLDDATLDAMLGFGVNRISLGVQSLVDREAAATGRFHTRSVVLRDLARMRSAGVKRLSIDLIAGMPHQTMESWQESLDVLVATGVGHASVYMLEIDEESRLGRELLAGGARYHAQTVPGEELTAELYQRAVGALEASGLGQYEISNFARGGSEAQHNLKYWRRKPYLGFGLDAHSMVRAHDGAALRFNTTDALDEYMGAESHLEPRRLKGVEEIEEAWFLGLRLRAGVAWLALAAEFGWDRVEIFRPVVRELCDLGLVIEEEGIVRLTPRGVLFSNEVFARFLGVAEEEFQVP
ncbi:MAG TPA: radical SAM family heme chaperone HemW [Acidobacteriaceae bacterium]|nr:radical SAM family heme chaperone HemW [Acidobacteriaceae bacterium]